MKGTIIYLLGTLNGIAICTSVVGMFLVGVYAGKKIYDDDDDSVVNGNA